MACECPRRNIVQTECPGTGALASLRYACPEDVTSITRTTEANGDCTNSITDIVVVGTTDEYFHTIDVDKGSDLTPEMTVQRILNDDKTDTTTNELNIRICDDTPEIRCSIKLMFKKKFDLILEYKDPDQDYGYEYFAEMELVEYNWRSEIRAWDLRFRAVNPVRDGELIFITDRATTDTLIAGITQP